MGAYTCEFGIVHKRCRCPQPHTIKCDVPDQHRPVEPKETLEDFIQRVEGSFFRTGHDWGANPNALLVWNLVREHAGMDRLTRDDLIRRHAETDGKTFDEIKVDYEKFDAWYAEQRR